MGEHRRGGNRSGSGSGCGGRIVGHHRAQGKLILRLLVALLVIGEVGLPSRQIDEQLVNAGEIHGSYRCSPCRSATVESC